MQLSTLIWYVWLISNDRFRICLQLEKQIASNERERQYTELSGSMPGLTKKDHNIDGDNLDTLDEPISITVVRLL
jgi:hypothetical protein